jgi:hypothetical protein
MIVGLERAVCIWGKTRRKKCPSCNARAKKGDIRPIWAPKLVATDTSARDEALAKCQAEQNKRIKVRSCANELLGPWRGLVTQYVLSFGFGFCYTLLAGGC